MGWREMALPWDEMLTALVFVTLVGPDDPEARAAAEAARQIAQGLGARRVLALFDQALGGQDGPGTDGGVAAAESRTETATATASPA